MKKIVIDPSRCEGHGRCTQYAPDVFGYDDTTNQASVLAGADIESNAEGIRRAVEGCPEQAISLVEDREDQSVDS